MLDFVLTSAGVSATSGTTPITLTQVLLCDSSHTPIGTAIEDFVGNVTKDEYGVGDYIVVDFSTTMPSNAPSPVQYIRLAASVNGSNTVIAESEPVSLLNTAGKQLKLRITARLFTTNSEETRENRSAKFAFNCTTIGLPYATKKRQGVVRLADPDMTASGDTHKDNTVFTAHDTILKIEEYVHSADQYVPWNTDASDNPIIGTLSAETIHVTHDYDDSTALSSTLTADVNGNLVVSTPITGTNAVTSTPDYGSTTIATSAISGDTHLTTSDYIEALYSNSIDTAGTETAAARKLVTSHAVRAYVEAKDALVVHKAGTETITDVKTFNANIATGNGALITGSAVQSQYDDGATPDPQIIWDAVENYSKLPTVEVVSKALADIESESSDITADLQRQIDALNAGQNLADIVATTSDLTSHPIDNLQPGDGQTVVGDKIQVLHDTGDNSTVYELRSGSATGDHDLPSSSSTQQNPVYWHYIGEYGNDAYSKSDADDTFFRKDHVATSTNSSDEYVPSAKLMYTELAKYVKLQSSSRQTIQSEIAIKTASTHSSSQAETFTYTTGNLTANGQFGIFAGDGRQAFLYLDDYNNNETYPAIKFGGSSTSQSAMIDFLILSGSNAEGAAVADYSDAGMQAAVDGRLVTVDYLNTYTGSMSDYAKKNDNNTFIAGKTNTFNGSVVLNGSVTGDSVYGTYAANTWNTASTSADLATVSAVNGAIEDKVADLTDDVLIHASDINAVGSIGLFIYTEPGNELTYGSEIDGQYLKAVGMSLPMSGQISYKAAALVPSCSGTWKLLSLAVKRTTTEPCLVMAQKIHDTYPKPQS